MSETDDNEQSKAKNTVPRGGIWVLGIVFTFLNIDYFLRWILYWILKFRQLHVDKIIYIQNNRNQKISFRKQIIAYLRKRFSFNCILCITPMDTNYSTVRSISIRLTLSEFFLFLIVSVRITRFLCGTRILANHAHSHSVQS